MSTKIQQVACIWSQLFTGKYLQILTGRYVAQINLKKKKGNEEVYLQL